MNSPVDRVDDVTVAGSGDAGLLTALLLKEYNPLVDVEVVGEFDNADHSEVKSTSRNITKTLHDFLGISKERFFAEVNPVWMVSVYFEDWCGSDPFHIPFRKYVPRGGQTTKEASHAFYHRYQNNISLANPLVHGLVEERRSPFLRIKQPGEWEIYTHTAYHLDTAKFTRFLRQVCQERGIDVIDEEITTVQVVDDQIQKLTTTEQNYAADLYIDATGFDRKLMQHLENSFTEFDSPLDTILTAHIERGIDSIVPATVVTSGDNGWFRQIDTLTHRNIGYVYSSSHVSDEDAITELRCEYDEDIDPEIVNQTRFASGAYDNAWVNNCVVIGDAHGFVEPLQSLGVSLSAGFAGELATMLAEQFRTNHAGFRDAYNQFTGLGWEGAYDFVSVHYLENDGETEFWEDMQGLPVSERVENHVKNFRENGLSSHDICVEEVKGPSTAWLHYSILYGMDCRIDLYENTELVVDRQTKTRIETEQQDGLGLAQDHLSYPDLLSTGVYGEDPLSNVE